MKPTLPPTKLSINLSDIDIQDTKKIIIEPDTGREKLFSDAYSLNTKIKTTNYRTLKNDWVAVILKFRDSLGKNYGLIEYFNEQDNATHHVDLEYEDKKSGWQVKTYKRFIDAEKDMVELMRRRIEGLDGDVN